MSNSLEDVRILVVEDEPLIGLAIEDALIDAGARVQLAKTDREAYEALENGDATHVLIADIDLREGTTGFDVARFARRRNPSIHVLYMSGASSDSTFSFGVDRSEFLMKPVAEQRLVKTVEQMIRTTA